MMKVLLVIDRLEVGGAEKVFCLLIELLSKESINVGVLLFNTGYPLEKDLPEGVSIHRLNRSNKYSFTKLYLANNICKGYDIVHAHFRHVHAYIKAAQLLFKGRYKLVLHDHSGLLNNVPSRLKYFLRPAYYIGVNKNQIDWAKELVKVEAQQCYLLENTVLPSSDVAIHRLTKEEGILLVANVRRVKNIEFAIELAKAVNEDLYVIGNVPDNEYYQELVSSTNSNIHFQHEVSNVNILLPKYSFAIHCSKQETGPLVLLEYLSAGLPFLSYYTGSVAEKVAQDLPELFIANFDVSQWINRIEEIRSQKDLPDRMRRVFEKYYSADKYINKCLKIYESVYYS